MRPARMLGTGPGHGRSGCDRQAVAAYLHDRGWSQASIAEALNAAQGTIAKDLAKQPVIIPGNNYQDHDEAVATGKRKNRPGAGRPRGSGKRLKAKDEIDREAWPLFDAGMTRPGVVPVLPQPSEEA